MSDLSIDILEKIEGVDLNSLGQDDLVKLYYELNRTEKSLQTHKALQDPIDWAEEVLGILPHTILWDQCPDYPEDHNWDSGIYTHDGKDIFVSVHNPIAVGMRALANQRRRVGIEGGTGTAKTFAVGAIMVLYFLEKYGPQEGGRPDCRVFTFSTKEDQLKNHIWKDIGSMWPRFKERHPAAIFLPGSLRIYMQGNAENRDAWSARGYSARVGASEEAASAVKGIHGVHLFFVFEEMQGIDPAIPASIRATCAAPNNIILALGNPQAEFDNLHKFCISPGTMHLRVSSLDHPNVVLNDPYVVPGAASRLLVEEILDYVGSDENDPYYLSNVRGVCPMGSQLSIISETLLNLTKPYALSQDSKEVDTTIHGHPELPHTAGSEGVTIIYTSRSAGTIKRYIGCCDIAGDDLKGDWHSCIIGDRVEKTPVAIIHMRGPREEFAQEVVRVMKMYNVRVPEENAIYQPLLAWERNMGAFNLEPNIKKYPNVYRSKNLDIKNSKRGKVLGWYTGSRSRYEMQEALKKWLASLHDNPERLVSSELRSELSTFVATAMLRGGKTRYEAAPSCFDDIVLSWMLFLAIDQEMADQPPLEVGVIKAYPYTPKMREEEAEKKSKWGAPGKWGGGKIKSW